MVIAGDSVPTVHFGATVCSGRVSDVVDDELAMLSIRLLNLIPQSEFRDGHGILKPNGVRSYRMLLLGFRHGILQQEIASWDHAKIFFVERVN